MVGRPVQYIYIYYYIRRYIGARVYIYMYVYKYIYIIVYNTFNRSGRQTWLVAREPVCVCIIAIFPIKSCRDF